MSVHCGYGPRDIDEMVGRLVSALADMTGADGEPLPDTVLDRVLHGDGVTASRGLLREYAADLLEIGGDVCDLVLFRLGENIALVE